MIRTTAGDIEPPLTGIILPHEHIHTDLLPLSEGGDRKVSTSVIRQAVEQKLRRAVRAGVALLIECTPPYVGQNVEAVAEVGEATRLPVVVATGLYKESFQPPWALNASVSEISDWMMRDLEEGIDGTDVRAGFIKLAVTDGGVTSQEGNILSAAIEVSNRTGAAIASHSPVGSNAVHQLKTIEQAGGDTSRYIHMLTPSSGSTFIWMCFGAGPGLSATGQAGSPPHCLWTWTSSEKYSTRGLGTGYCFRRTCAVIW